MRENPCLPPLSLSLSSLTLSHYLSSNLSHSLLSYSFSLSVSLFYSVFLFPTLSFSFIHYFLFQTLSSLSYISYITNMINILLRSISCHSISLFPLPSSLPFSLSLVFIFLNNPSTSFLVASELAKLTRFKKFELFCSRY